MRSHSSIPKTISAIVIFIVFLAGCSGIATLPPITVTSIVPSEMPSLVPAEITSTPLPISTSQPITSVTIADECIPIEENIPADLTLSGVWLRNEVTPYFENLDDHADYIVPFKGGGLLDEYAISPDGEHLAYIDPYVDPKRNGTEKRILRVIRSSGHTLNMDYWAEDWQWIIGWFDNENLVLYTSQNRVVILNPFTGEWKKFQEPTWLKNVSYDKYNYGYDSYSGPFYNPKLSKILVKNDFKAFDLKDVQSGETIFQGTGYLSPSDFDWSSDGLTLAIASDDGYILNVLFKDRIVAEFDVRKQKVDSASISVIELSYDAHKLAFIAYDGYFILDVQQQTVVTLCQDNNLQIVGWRNHPSWSPDNRFIIQGGYVNGESFDILIDTQKMHAYKLISGQFQHRLTWLAKP